MKVLSIKDFWKRWVTGDKVNDSLSEIPETKKDQLLRLTHTLEPSVFEYLSVYKYPNHRIPSPLPTIDQYNQWLASICYMLDKEPIVMSFDSHAYCDRQIHLYFLDKNGYHLPIDDYIIEYQKSIDALMTKLEESCAESFFRKNCIIVQSNMDRFISYARALSELQSAATQIVLLK